MAQSLCNGCGKVFKSVAGFDKHRTGKFEPNTRRCMTTEEMLAVGMLLNDQQLWIGSAYDPTIRHAEDEQEVGV